VRTKGDWAVLWESISEPRKSSSSPPPVDFTQEVVLVAMVPALGLLETIEIETVENQGGTLVASVRRRRPFCVEVDVPLKCERGRGVPIDVVRVRAAGAPVRFRELPVGRPE
jgi:hypothetical protein